MHETPVISQHSIHQELSQDTDNDKMPENVKVTSVASSSVAPPEIDGLMDTVKLALDTYNYLMSQSWEDHYPASKMHPYIDLGLHDAALETC